MRRGRLVRQRAPMETLYKGPHAHLVVHCRKAPYDVYIGRPNPRIKGDGAWGNPFKLDRDGDRDTVIARYREWLIGQPALVARARAELRGKVLACWCAPLACHGHVLAEVANGEEPPGGGA